MKVAIVGGGSSYTPELIEGIIKHHNRLPVTEVSLTDINPRRLEILHGFSQRMIAQTGLDIRVTATTDLTASLQDATFVNCLIRVGGMSARINDEHIPLNYGIVGQETTGPGGMMKALRTIPVILELAKMIEKVCPSAWLINYTNPSGIIAEALGNFSKIQWVGLCSGPNVWTTQILAALGVEPQRANVDWLGLNHLGFAVRVWVDGKNVTSQAIDAIAKDWPVDIGCMKAIGCIPATYLKYYFHHDRMVKEMTQPGYHTRGEQVLQIEAELLRQYADPTLTEKPALLKQRGGGGYSDTAIAAMHAIYHNTGSRQVLQTINNGAINGLPDNGSVEVPCVLDQKGPHPLCMGEIPLPIRGLIQSVKCYESLTVKAAVEGSKEIALQALMAHPLVPGWEVARLLLDDLLATNKEWLSWVS